MHVQDGIKRWMESAKSSFDVLKQLNATLGRATGDLSRAEKARKRKQATEQAAAAKKAAKKQEQEKKALQDSLKKVEKSGSQLLPVLFQDLPIFNDLLCVPEKAFSGKIAAAGEGPYLVQGADDLASIMEAGCGNILSVFAAQFPTAQQAREKGRVQSLLKVPEAQESKMKEAVMSMTRTDVEIWGDKEFGDLSNFHLYGFMGNMIYAGPEFNSLASLRYTHRGERQVILVSFSDFWGMLSADQQQHELSGTYNVTHYLQDLLRNASSEDHFMKQLLDMAGKGNKVVFKGIVGPKSVLFVPAGTLVIERCLNGGINVGLRLSLKDGSALGVQSLTSMLQLHQQYAGTSSQVEMWKKALSMSKAKPAS